MPVEPSVLMDLHAETPEGEIRQRKAYAKGGRPAMKNGQPVMLDYVTARYVQQRLDDVVGPENWQASFTERAGGSIECTISINVWADYAVDGTAATKRIGAWISKADVGVPSMIEPAKGAYSDAFKRAAVHWGIARDLYEERDESEIAPAAEPPTTSIQSRVAGWDEEEEEAPRPARRPVQSAAPRRYGTSRPAYRQQVQRSSRNEERDAELMLVAEQDIEAGDPPWVCPEHGTVQLMPGGVSKAGKPYGPWLACGERNCDDPTPKPYLSDLYKGQ